MSIYVPQHATEQDREDAWRHAFSYADCYTTTEGAVAYARHYMAVVADEEDMAYWPSHTDVFGAWRRKEGNEYAIY